MKKIYIILFLIFSAVLLSACNRAKTLVVYNFGEYLSTEVKDEFYKKTKITIKEINYDQSQIAETSIRANNKYDIYIGSEFSINNLKDEKINGKNLINKLNWDKIKYKKENLFSPILEEVIKKLDKTIGYNILDYLVPYGWGSMGILYNSDKVSREDVEKYEWDIIRNNKNFKRAIYDSPVETTAIALKALGIDIASASKEDILKARDWLNNIPRKNTKFITDAIFDDVPRGDVDLVYVISGEAGEIIRRVIDGKNAPNLKYYIPKRQGSNIWIDGISIPNGANLDLAYEFINFMLDSKMNKLNSDELGFCSPLNDVYEKQKEELLEEISEAKDKKEKELLEQVYNTLNVVEQDKNEIFLFNKDVRKDVDENWIYFKSSYSLKGWWDK